MQKFTSSIPKQQLNLYQKILLISSLSSILPSKLKVIPQNNKSSTIKYSQNFINNSLQEQDLINLCKYINPDLQPIQQSKKLLSKLTEFKQQQQENTCLHIAAEYGNISLLKYLLKNYNQQNKRQLDKLSLSNSYAYKKINQRNKNYDTPLMHCLRNNSDHKMQKIVLQLYKYSDLTLCDKKNMNIYETPLPVYSVSKVRILEFLKEKFQQKLTQK